MEVGQPQAARPLHQARKGAVPRRWARAAAGSGGREQWQGGVAVCAHGEQAAADAACDEPQRRRSVGGWARMHARGARTRAAVCGVSTPPSEAACLAAACKFQDQSPKPVSSTLNSTKLGREPRREADSVAAIASTTRCLRRAPTRRAAMFVARDTMSDVALLLPASALERSLPYLPERSLPL